MNIRELSEQEINAFRQDGFCYIPKLVDAETITRLLEAADHRMANPGKHAEELAKKGRFFQEQYMFPEVPVFREFMTNVDMAKNAGLAMGATQVRAYFDHLFTCEPDTKVDYYWHQDLPYWPIDGKQICSFWLALTDCSRESSALQFVKGAEKPDRMYKQTDFGDAPLDPDKIQIEHDSNAEVIPQFDKYPEKYELITWNFSAGDAVLFNAHVVHSSGGNTSLTQRRVAYSSRWIGEDTVFKVRPGFQDPALFPDKDENISEGESLDSRRFPLVWQA